MTLKASDLPKSMRDRLETEGRPVARSKARDEADRRPCPYICHSCGTPFERFGGKAGWEAHSRETGHVWGEMIFEVAG